MSGYSYEHGMSNNAVDAYEEGRKPLSRISAADLEAAGWTGTKRQALALAKAKFWRRSEWHHSGGTWYNEVDFYDPADLVEIWDDLKSAERIETLRAAMAATKPTCQTDRQRVKGEYTVWGGSRRSPRRLGVEDFTGHLVGNWIQMDGGGRKKASGNHIKWEYV